MSPVSLDANEHHTHSTRHVTQTTQDPPAFFPPSSSPLVVPCMDPQKWEWAVNQHRDTYASYVGHHSLRKRSPPPFVLLPNKPPIFPPLMRFLCPPAPRVCTRLYLLCKSFSPFVVFSFRVKRSTVTFQVKRRTVSLWALISPHLRLCHAQCRTPPSWRTRAWGG